MSDQVSVLVETLSAIYVHYFDCKIALMTSKVKGKFLILHRILQTTPAPHHRPPLSQSLLIVTGIYLQLLKTKRKGEKLKQGFRSSCQTTVRVVGHGQILVGHWSVSHCYLWICIFFPA